MTFRAFVESTQKSTGKRRRMHSSSDAITQEVRRDGEERHNVANVFLEICANVIVRSQNQRDFFAIPVHGLTHALHSPGYLDDATRQVHQRCTEEARGGGGMSRSFIRSLSAFGFVDLPLCSWGWLSVPPIHFYHDDMIPPPTERGGGGEAAEGGPSVRAAGLGQGPPGPSRGPLRRVVHRSAGGTEI